MTVRFYIDDEIFCDCVMLEEDKEIEKKKLPAGREIVGFVLVEVQLSYHVTVGIFYGVTGPDSPKKWMKNSEKKEKRFGKKVAFFDTHFPARRSIPRMEVSVQTPTTLLEWWGLHRPLSTRLWPFPSIGMLHLTWEKNTTHES